LNALKRVREELVRRIGASQAFEWSSVEWTWRGWLCLWLVEEEFLPQAQLDQTVGPPPLGSDAVAERVVVESFWRAEQKREEQHEKKDDGSQGEGPPRPHRLVREHGVNESLGLSASV
jgi:hypothetical protein